jgi:hypothetical protein
LQPSIRATQVADFDRDPMSKGNKLFHEYNPQSNPEKSQLFFELNQECLVKWAEMFPIAAGSMVNISGFKEAVEDLTKEGIVLPDSRNLSAYYIYSQVSKKNNSLGNSLEFSRKSVVENKVDTIPLENSAKIIREGLEEISSIQNVISIFLQSKSESHLAEIEDKLKTAAELFTKYKPYFNAVLKSNDPKYSLQRRLITNERNYIHDARAECKKFENYQITYAELCESLTNLGAKTALRRRDDHTNNSLTEISSFDGKSSKNYGVSEVSLVGKLKKSSNPNMNLESNLGQLDRRLSHKLPELQIENYDSEREVMSSSVQQRPLSQFFNAFDNGNAAPPPKIERSLSEFTKGAFHLIKDSNLDSPKLEKTNTPNISGELRAKNIDIQHKRSPSPTELFVRQDSAPATKSAEPLVWEKMPAVSLPLVQEKESYFITHTDQEISPRQDSQVNQSESNLAPKRFTRPMQHKPTGSFYSPSNVVNQSGEQSSDNIDQVRKESLASQRDQLQIDTKAPLDQDTFRSLSKPIAKDNNSIISLGGTIQRKSNPEIILTQLGQIATAPQVSSAPEQLNEESFHSVVSDTENKEVKVAASPMPPVIITPPITNSGNSQQREEFQPTIRNKSSTDSVVAQLSLAEKTISEVGPREANLTREPKQPPRQVLSGLLAEKDQTNPITISPQQDVKIFDEALLRFNSQSDFTLTPRSKVQENIVKPAKNDKLSTLNVIKEVANGHGSGGEISSSAGVDSGAIIIKANMMQLGDSKYTINNSINSPHVKDNRSEMGDLKFDIKPSFGKAAKAFILENKEDLDKHIKMAPDSIYDSSALTLTINLSKPPTNPPANERSRSNTYDPNRKSDNADTLLGMPSPNIANHSQPKNINLTSTSSFPLSPIPDLKSPMGNIAGQMKSKHIGFDFKLDDSVFDNINSVPKTIRPLQSPHDNKTGYSAAQFGNVAHSLRDIQQNTTNMEETSKGMGSVKNVQSPNNRSITQDKQDTNIVGKLFEPLKLPIVKHADYVSDLSDGYEEPSILSQKTDELELHSARSFGLEILPELPNNSMTSRDSKKLKKINILDSNMMQSGAQEYSKARSSMAKTPSWAHKSLVTSSNNNNNTPSPMPDTPESIDLKKFNSLTVPTSSGFKPSLPKHLTESAVNADYPKTLMESQVVNYSPSRDEHYRAFSFNLPPGSSEALPLVITSKVNSGINNVEGSRPASINRVQSSGGPNSRINFSNLDTFGQASGAIHKSVTNQSDDYFKKYESVLKKNAEAGEQLADRTIKELKEKLITTEKDKDSALQRIIFLQQKYQEEMSQVAKKAQEEVYSAHIANEELLYTIHSLKMQLSLAQGYKEDEKRSIERGKMLEVELAKLQEQNITLTSELALIKTSKRQASLQESSITADHPNLKMRLDALSKDFEGKVAFMKEKFLEEKEEIDRVHKLEIQNYQAKIKQLQVSIDQKPVQERIVEIKDPTEELRYRWQLEQVQEINKSELKRINEAHSFEIAGHVSTIKELQATLSNVREAEEKSSLKVAELDKLLLNKSSELKQAQETLESLNNQLNQLRTDNITLQRGLNTKENEFVESSVKLSELTKKHTSILKQIEDYKKREEEMKKDIEDYHRRIVKLTEIVNTPMTNSDNDPTIMRLNEQMAVSLSKMKELLEENTKLKQTILEKEIDISVASTSFSNERMFLKKIENENTELKKQLHELSCSRLKDTDAREELEVAVNEIEHLKREANLLKLLLNETTASKEAIAQEFLNYRSPKVKVTFNIQTQTEQEIQSPYREDGITDSELEQTGRNTPKKAFDKQLSSNQQTKSQPVLGPVQTYTPGRTSVEARQITSNVEENQVDYQFVVPSHRISYLENTQRSDNLTFDPNPKNMNTWPLKLYSNELITVLLSKQEAKVGSSDNHDTTLTLIPELPNFLVSLSTTPPNLLLSPLPEDPLISPQTLALASSPPLTTLTLTLQSLQQGLFTLTLPIPSTTQPSQHPIPSA